MNQDNNTWMGKEGFDEAYYYEDKKTDIGLTYSDETIMAKIKESFGRNLSGFNYELTSDQGKVEIRSHSLSYKDEAIKLANEVSGVKSVTFSGNS